MNKRAKENKRRKIADKTFLEGLDDLLDIAARMLTAYELKKILQQILETSLEASGGNTGSLMLLDEKTHTLGIEAAVGLDKEIMRTKRIKIGDEIAGWVAKRGESTLLIGNLRKDKRFYKFAKKNEIKSAISVPLKIEHKVIGVLNINSLRSESQFDKGDLKFISFLASQAAIAIWHVRLYEEAERARRKCVETRKQLIIYEKMTTLGELSAGIAHELDNPLAVISANVQYLISNTSKNDPMMDELIEIDKASKRCLKIIQRLLRYSRPSKYEGTSIDVNSIIMEVLNLVKYQISLKGIKIVKNLSPSLPGTIIDPDELKEVFLNIIINAKYAMPRGGRLTITTVNIKNSKSILIEFKDSGPGIAPEQIDKIFDPFFTTRRPGNLGLGLSICQRIITEHKGNITVDSKPGKGAEFRIELPAEQLAG